MRILVAGTGRSGTCLLVEIPRGLDVVKFSKRVEDRRFFKYENLPENYGTKLVTAHPSFTIKNMISFMKKYEDLRLIFSLRHPIDIFMSKIRRGQKASSGGDRSGEWISEDGTTKGAISAIKDFHDIYNMAVAKFPDRVMSVKIEDLIVFPNTTVERIASWLGVMPTKRAYKFYEHDRNKYHKKHRYRRRLDVSQVSIYKRWKTVYDGFFKNRKGDLLDAVFQLGEIIEDLGYKKRVKMYAEKMSPSLRQLNGQHNLVGAEIGVYRGKNAT